MSETLVNQNQISSESWVKPADWVDLRSCCCENSIYFLVGCKKDLLDCYHFDETGKLVSVDEDVYLETSGDTYGTQYINTTVIPNNNTRIVLKCSNFPAQNNNDWIFGSRTGAYNREFGFLAGSNHYIDCFGSSRLNVSNSITDLYEFDKNKNITVVNTNAETLTHTNSTWTGTYPIFLFCLNNAGNPAGIRSGERIYSSIIYQNGVKAQELVPVPAGLVIGSYTVPSNGMFDIVTQTFYANAGTGDFLIGVKENYPEISIYAEISNTGNYDVYVDGSKVATTASEGTTTLNWEALNLSTGFDVTYPKPLKTHIVRVTPSVLTNNITAIHLVPNSSVEQGVLWAHFQVTNRIKISNLFSPNDDTMLCSVVEAVTAVGDLIDLAWSGLGMAAFRNCINLKYIPTLDGHATMPGLSTVFYGCESLKQIKIQNFSKMSNNYAAFGDCKSLEYIIVDKPIDSMYSSGFVNCNKLRRLPPFEAYPTLNIYITNCFNLEPTFLDFSTHVGGDTSVWNIRSTDNTRKQNIVGIMLNQNMEINNNLDFSNNMMQHQALVDLLNSLPTLENRLTINISGNPGTVELTQEDIAIGTNKNWEVAV